MSNQASDPWPEIASEGIVVVDLVESTATNNRFGWYSVGRGMMRDLRQIISNIGSIYGLKCVKSTGDGYLMSFRVSASAEIAAVNAVMLAFDVMSFVRDRNSQLSEERAIHLRFAVHFGEVDVLEYDREGPNVSYAFRIEKISPASLATAINAIPTEEFPSENYVLCSEQVAAILTKRSPKWRIKRIGLFKLRGFAA
jgi:class 3 adenylate cyclase